MAILKKWVRKKYFEDILEGDKTVEVRSPDSRDNDYRNFAEGDILKLKNEERGTACFELTGVANYNSAQELLYEEGVESVLPEADRIEEAEEEIHGVYEPDRINKNGIYAIRLGDLLRSNPWPFLSEYEEAAMPF
ncbi:MAG: ASCH domain-containing protein [Candidatus Nanohaloarchaea archaeon]